MTDADAGLVPRLELSCVMKEELPQRVKETSTVGDLVSFTDNRISPVRQIYRQHSHEDAGEFPLRRNSLKISDTDRTVKGRGSRKCSIISNSPFSPEKSISTSPLDEQDTPRHRIGHRNAMLNALRENLASIPCVQAVRKHPSNNSFNKIERGYGLRLEVNDMNEDRISPHGRKIFRCDSRMSASSYASSQGIVTTVEQRKQRVIQTLDKMNGQAERYKRPNSVDNQTGEVAILEASYGRGKKRASIATHVLMKTRKRRVHPANRDVNKADIFIGTASPIGKSEIEILSEEQKERSTKMFHMLKNAEKLSQEQKELSAKALNKSEKPNLIESMGNEKDSTTNEGVAKVSNLSFWSKLRKKKFSFLRYVYHHGFHLIYVVTMVAICARIKPIEVFRKHAKFIVLLLRVWKIHSVAINEDLVDNNSSLDMITFGDQPDLMFDVTAYKASKDAKILLEVKRILLKKPQLRTEDELYYMQIFLRNYKSIAEYPVRMQRMITQRSWIESFDVKRVIVREGHVPMCFYFILSGSALVSTMYNGAPKTVMFLSRGDSFGDVAILNNARRETTVISRQKIELLCMTNNDFVDIFMSGGVRDPNDPFLKSIHFLNGWPREKLIDNPKKCIFSYFKRGTILLNDSSNSDWIFVVKSGSASLLKKLDTVNIKRKPKAKKMFDFRGEVMEVMKHEKFLSHKEQLRLMFEEEKHNIRDQSLHLRFYALPEINVQTNETYSELRKLKEEFVNANTVNRALGALEKSGVENICDSPSNAMDKKPRKESLINVILKGPFIKGGGPLVRDSSFASLTSRNSRDSTVSNQKGVRFVDHHNSVAVARKAHGWEHMSLQSTSTCDSPLNDLAIRPHENRPVFVEVKALTHGQVFGLADMLFENQPQFSLVSNGAECIMIERKFFLEHASQRLMVALRESTYPYPSKTALQKNLETQMRWNVHKVKILNRHLRDIKIRRFDTHNAREHLYIPPVHV